MATDESKKEDQQSTGSDKEVHVGDELRKYVPNGLDRKLMVGLAYSGRWDSLHQYMDNIGIDKNDKVKVEALAIVLGITSIGNRSGKPRGGVRNQGIKPSGMIMYPEDPPSQASRSCTIIFTNTTGLGLGYIGDSLSHGEWYNKPPGSLGAHGQWSSESDGDMTGTQGSVQYQYNDNGSPINLTITWDVPWDGSNTFTTQSGSKNYTLTYSTSGNDNATLNVTFAKS